MSKKRILFGAVDIGWRIEHFTKFINDNFSNELLPESLVYFKVKENQYKTKYDYEYNIQGKLFVYRWFIHFYFFISSIFKYDIFYFFSGETLLPRKLRRIELRIYRILKRRVIFHFVGSDIRNPEYIEWKGRNIKEFLDGEIHFSSNLAWQKKLINDAVKYSNQIIVSSPDLLSIIPDASFYPVLIDYQKFLIELEQIPYPIKNENEIVILHSPSNIKLKGSDIIERILLKIKNESKLNIKLVLPRHSDKSLYSVTRYELFKLYKEADIVIDQLLIGWYGLQSVEALIVGCQVISYIQKDLESYLFPECPICNANANTLESVVLNCIKAKQLGKLNVSQNQNWVKKYHTIENNNQVLKKAFGFNKN